MKSVVFSLLLGVALVGCAPEQFDPAECGSGKCDESAPGDERAGIEREIASTEWTRRGCSDVLQNCSCQSCSAQDSCQESMSCDAHIAMLYLEASDKKFQLVRADPWPEAFPPIYGTFSFEYPAAGLPQLVLDVEGTIVSGRCEATGNDGEFIACPTDPHRERYEFEYIESLNAPFEELSGLKIRKLDDEGSAWLHLNTFPRG